MPLNRFHGSKNEVRGARACSDKGMRTSGVGARPLITLSLASPTAARIACESSTCCSACGRKGAGAHAPTTGANPNTLTSYDMPTFRLCKEGEHVAHARQHHEHDLALLLKLDAAGLEGALARHLRVVDDVDVVELQALARMAREEANGRLLLESE